jgi:uncharacterized protein YukE
MTPGPLIAAPAAAEPAPWAGVWIAEDIELIDRGVRSGSWVDGTLGTVGAGLDGLAFVSDPVGALLQYGIAWLIEHVKPLSEALDWLAGDPAQITAHAQTWRNVSSALASEADGLASAVRSDVADWSGSAAAAYRSWTAQREQSLRALGKASETMALITEAAGALIGTVRMMVRDAVATVVSRLIVYAAELVATAGLATPLVAEQVATLCASWAARISRWLKGLLSSLRKLLSESGRLSQLIETLRARMNGESGKAGTDGSPPARDEPESGTDKSEVPDGPRPPDFGSVEVDSNKISGYAMNPDHPVGGNKYRVIHSATGLGVDDAASVERQIRDGVRMGTPILGKVNEWGQRWAVDVPLIGPSGSMTVRTAWILDNGSTMPRLVTISFPKQE